MKKRVLTIALALLLMMSMAVPALAIDTSGGTDDATLTYTVEQGFTVTIPEDATITDGTGEGTLSVSDIILDFDKSLTVKLTGANMSGSTFRLKDGTNDNYLAYTIAAAKATGAPNEVTVTASVANDTTFLTVPAGVTSDFSVELDYTVTDTVTTSGTYTDTLTFTVTVG